MSGGNTTSQNLCHALNNENLNLSEEFYPDIETYPDEIQLQKHLMKINNIQNTISNNNNNINDNSNINDNDNDNINNVNNNNQVVGESTAISRRHTSRRSSNHTRRESVASIDGFMNALCDHLQYGNNVYENIPNMLGKDDSPGI